MTHLMYYFFLGILRYIPQKKTFLKSIFDREKKKYFYITTLS